MRLLNTATLEFEELFGDRVPEYAILSHRWEFGEVPFEELHSPTARKKKGYAKICDFCDEVRSQGYDYAWVDTCCINKKDFTELAEAVNSMFSWYKNSSTCLIYLSDFLFRPELGQQQFEFDLAKSQWFRRGWTLQELIAPAQVKFYDSKWRYFGTKRDLASVISKITGISEALLQGKRDLKNFSCAQKMSWAAIRQTTRPEDRTYSLLGLFGVSLPLIYDGDGSKAFKRLQEEIIKNSTDQSIFAWVQHGPSPFVQGGRTTFDQKCSILAPSPDCFRFSSSIVPCKREASDAPYSLTNTGLDITQRVCRVIYSGDLVLLEVLLDCYDKDKEDNRVSITVAGSKLFYKSISLENHSRLPVSRVEPRYLGVVSKEVYDGKVLDKVPRRVPVKDPVKVPLQISPISVDSDQTWLSADVSWMNDPLWEVETRRKMDLARRQIQNLYEEGARAQKIARKKAKNEALLGIGIFLFGAYALQKVSR
jgi:hypothetical protein